MTYDDLRGKLFLDSHALLVFAEIGELDRLERLHSFTVIEASVVQELRHIADSGNSVRQTDAAAAVLERLEEGRLGIVRQSSSAASRSAAETFGREIEMNVRATTGETKRRARRAALRTFSAAVEHRGAVTSFAPANSRLLALLEGVPMLSPTELNVLMTHLDDDPVEGARIQRKLVDAGFSTTTRQFGTLLDRGPLLDVVDNGRRVSQRLGQDETLETRDPQTVYLSTDLVLAMLTKGDASIARLPSNVVIPQGVMEELREFNALDPKPYLEHFFETNRLEVRRFTRPRTVQILQDRLQGRMRASRVQSRGRGLAEALALAATDSSGVVVTDDGEVALLATADLGPQFRPKLADSYEFYERRADGTDETEHETISKWRAHRNAAGRPVPDDRLPSRPALPVLQEFDVALMPRPTPAERTNSTLPMFYPDAAFFMGLSSLMREDRSLAEAIIDRTAGQMMITSGVRAMAEQMARRNYANKLMLETEALAMPVDGRVFADQVPLVADHLQAAIGRRLWDEDHVAAEIAVMAASEVSGWACTSKLRHLDHLNQAFASAAPELTVPIGNPHPVISYDVMFESLLQDPAMSVEQKQQLLDAVERLYQCMSLDPPDRDILLEGERARALGVPTLPSTRVTSSEPRRHATMTLTDFVERAEKLRRDVHDLTITSWSNRVLRSIGNFLDIEEGRDTLELIMGEMAHEGRQFEIPSQRAQWREQLGLLAKDSFVDWPTARIVEEALVDPGETSINELLAAAHSLDYASKLTIVAAVEEAAVRRHVEEMMETALVDSVEIATGEERRPNAIRDIVRTVVGGSVKTDDRERYVPVGLVHAQRAMHRSTQRLTLSLVNRVAPDQLSTVFALNRALAASALVHPSRLSEGNRQAILRGMDAFGEPGESSSQAMLSAVGGLLDNAEISREVTRFLDTRNTVLTDLQHGISVAEADLKQADSKQAGRDEVPVASPPSSPATQRANTDRDDVDEPAPSVAMRSPFQPPVPVDRPTAPADEPVPAKKAARRRSSIGALFSDVLPGNDSRRAESPSLMAGQGEVREIPPVLFVAPSVPRDDLPSTATDHIDQASNDRGMNLG